MLAQIKEDIRLTFKGLNYIWNHDKYMEKQEEKRKDEIFKKELEELNSLVKLVKSQTRYKIVSREYEGKTYYAVWDEKKPYGNYIVEVEDSYKRALNYVRIRIEMSIDDYLETLTNGWITVEM